MPETVGGRRVEAELPKVPPPPEPQPEERRWSEADRELVAEALGHVRLFRLTNATWSTPEVAAERVLDALTAAGKLLPEPTETRTEWGVWWHAGDPEGVCDQAAQLRDEEEAHWHGGQGVGHVGITSYTLVRREHRHYPDGWFTPHWTRYSGPHTKEASADEQ